ncbi:methionyl-tRNA formyltransferase [Gracilimonas sp.]|uniref:methionyl-tRNA formyltransferase n=1 Tax=Gracilimonas sp. TaxID=1974203 RepID=UPI003BAAF704
MNILILTQDDPFYLAQQLDYLLERVPEGANIVGCVVFDVSPFGKKESIIEKALKTWRIFGNAFFLRYGMKYLRSKLSSSSKVEHVLEKHGIEKIKIEGSINSEDSLEKLKSYDPDLLISIAGNQIFKKALIELAPEGCLNLHTALLPKYRGLMPSFWVLKNNEDYTGVSVFFVDEGIDSGPILVQKKVKIENRTQEELIQHTKKVGMDAIIEAIERIREGGYELIPNPDKESTYYSFPTREDVNEFKRIGKRFY